MSVKESLPVKNKYELVPPDGGYGYVILLAVSVNYIALTAFGTCFGMIFNDFFVEMGMGSTGVTVLAGINAMCVALAGFFTGPLLKMMSMRKLAFSASFFFNAGAFGTVFVKTQAQFFITQGLLQSFGLGILYNVSCTALNDYFLQKRLFSMSFTQTLAAAATMVAPMIVGWCSTHYGFRGTLILISAVALQTFVASGLLQPVAWHMKKVAIKETAPEKKLLLDIPSNVKNIDSLHTPVIKLTDPENADDLFAAEKNFNEKLSKGNVVLTSIKNFLDWPLFKKFVLTCGCLGAPISIFADVTYVFFLAQALYDLKWTEDGVAWAFALIGFGDIATRIVFIFSSVWLNKLGSHLIYVIGLLIAIVTKLAMVWVTDYASTLIIITIMGISRCIIVVLYPLVVADSVKSEEFPSAMGISMMIYGLVSIIMGPIIGAVRDATGNYTTMFVILIGFMVAVTIAWSFELVINKRKRRTILLDDVPQTIKNEIN
ncbi:monocarboxylate transporter 13-like [Choristoneura fumiferana]|uniref:monocarboxylate transporter 13-like n=1 Tax=Choristoneura fumiferana TaxID=7141 RepID=UPI003D158315